MSLIETFTSNKNKALLWNLMLEADLFRNINPSNINTVKKVFENKIKAIVNSSEKYSNLMMMNKVLMKEIILDLDGMRYATPNIITNEDMSKNKQTQLNNAVQLHKQNFDTMINTKKPNDIDFRDKIDEPLGSEMDKLLADAISKREKELNMIIQQQPDVNKANSWLNVNPQPILKIDNTENISINVEEITQVLRGNPAYPEVIPSDTRLAGHPNSPVGFRGRSAGDNPAPPHESLGEINKTNKKVQFGKTEVIENESSFLNLLKPKKDNLDNENILNKLNEIHNDIKELLHLLANNKNT